MPSFTIHGLVPLLALLAVRRLDARKVWILWPLTFLPDLDYFFGFHRATLGNVFILLPAAALAGWGLLARPRRPEALEWALVAAVYLGSHLLMDVFTGGSVLLYPFSEYTVCYYAAIEVVTATNTLHPVLEPCSFEGIPTVVDVYTWLSPVEAAMLAFVVPLGFVMGLVSLGSYLRSRGSTPSEARVE